MSDTNISWTDKTWNCVVGCTRVSEGCRNCYAFDLHDMRHRAHLAGKNVPAQYAKPFKEVQLLPDRLLYPIKWKKPQRIFVNSMSDLFHEDVPDSYIACVFAVMESCPRHTFQILTKRAKRMYDLLSHDSFPMMVRKMGYDVIGPKNYREMGPHWMANVWLGVSCEDQQWANARIPFLIETPAAVRFVSYEPALGPIDFGEYINCFHSSDDPNQDDHSECYPRLDQIICGGESGMGRRECEVEWFADVAEQCKLMKVACFVKQDSGPKPGMRGRIPLPVWELKEYPKQRSADVS